MKRKEVKLQLASDHFHAVCLSSPRAASLSPNPFWMGGVEVQLWGESACL